MKLQRFESRIFSVLGLGHRKLWACRYYSNWDSTHHFDRWIIGLCWVPIQIKQIKHTLLHSFSTSGMEDFSEQEKGGFFTSGLNIIYNITVNEILEGKVRKIYTKYPTIYSWKMQWRKDEIRSKWRRQRAHLHVCFNVNSLLYCTLKYHIKNIASKLIHRRIRLLCIKRH